MKTWVNKTKVNGSVTGVNTGHLIDGNKLFITGAHPVYIGDIVINEDTGQQTVVTAINSESDLGLQDDIFTAIGQSYRIRCGFVEASGTPTSIATKKLIDANASFKSTGIRAGFTVSYNDKIATVIGVDSETQLTLSSDIITDTDHQYRVYPGEWVFVETLEDFQQGTKRLMAADSTELSFTSASSAKQFPFFSHPSGVSPKRIVSIIEAKVSGGSGTVNFLVDGTQSDSATVSATNYTIYTLEWTGTLTTGRHEARLDVTPPDSGTIYLRLVEFWFQES